MGAIGSGCVSQRRAYPLIEWERPKRHSDGMSRHLRWNVRGHTHNVEHRNGPPTTSVSVAGEPLEKSTGLGKFVFCGFDAGGGAGAGAGANGYSPLWGRRPRRPGVDPDLPNRHSQFWCLQEARVSEVDVPGSGRPSQVSVGGVGFVVGPVVARRVEY